MIDPLRLFGRLLLATFKVAGYSLVFLVQLVWYCVLGQPVKIGDALGDFGRGLIEAFAAIFERPFYGSTVMRRH